MSKFLLLQTAAPDAIVRLERTDLAGERKVIEDIYFRQQHHSSIEDFLNHHIHDCEAETGLLMQVCALCNTLTTCDISETLLCGKKTHQLHSAILTYLWGVVSPLRPSTVCYYLFPPFLLAYFAIHPCPIC